MGMPLIRELINEVRHECAICHEPKILRYLIEDECKMVSVCEECIDKILIGGKYGNGPY